MLRPQEAKLHTAWCWRIFSSSNLIQPRGPRELALTLGIEVFREVWKRSASDQTVPDEIGKTALTLLLQQGAIAAHMLHSDAASDNAPTVATPFHHAIERQFVAAGAGPPPLLILLHGSGEMIALDINVILTPPQVYFISGSLHKIYRGASE
jgi:hypothetical protein